MGRYKSAEPIARTREGWPILIYVEDDGTERYVVAHPQGRSYYSDRSGQEVSDPNAAAVSEPSANAGNLLGAGLVGILRAFLGPLGAAAGAGVGAWLGGEIAKEQAAKERGAKK